MDPLAPEYPELTPYQFASNSPISNIDLDGLEAKKSITNNTYFIELQNVTFDFVARRADQTFTESLVDREGSRDFGINSQMFDLPPGFTGRSQYIAAAMGPPQDPTDYTPQGYSIIRFNKKGHGRSSDQTAYFCQRMDCGISFGMGDAPELSFASFGGGTPIIIDGLPYGKENKYSANAPTNLPATGAPGPSNEQYLTQRSNGVYAGQNESLVGKTILAYRSVDDTWMLVSQQNGKKGFTLNEIRDRLIGMGYDNAIGFDGSTSATLVEDGQPLVEPDARKNNIIPVGINISVPEGN